MGCNCNCDHKDAKPAASEAEQKSLSLSAVQYLQECSRGDRSAGMLRQENASDGLTGQRRPGAAGKGCGR